MKQILNKSKLFFNIINQRCRCSSLERQLKNYSYMTSNNCNNSSVLSSFNHFPSLSSLSFRFLSDRRYSEKHEWIVLDENDKTVGTVGISHYAQEALGDVVYVQLPEVNSEFMQHDEIGSIESVKAANEIYTPVSGTIVETNEKLDEKPGLVNSSCYDDGWLFKIRMSDPQEFDGLMDEQAYEAFKHSMP